MKLDLTGLERLRARLDRIAHPDFILIMKTWMDIIEKDNRRGVLAGLDKDGDPLVPVTYRPIGKPKKPTRTQKNNPKKGARIGAFVGIGNAPAGLNNNLTSAEYRRLAGPPLAPRGAFSRVITNLKTTWTQTGRIYTAIGEWSEVVNRKGRRFLHYLFDGKGRFGPIPSRDLRGVRPDGIAKARSSARAWMIDQVRTHAHGG